MYKNLLSELNKHKISYSQVATLINITEKEFTDKVNGKGKFRLNEALKIRELVIKKNSSINYLFKNN